MSEIVQVIVATLSGFIVAFFAEPVKNYFQNRAKLRNLRIALHRELVFNYAVLQKPEYKIEHQIRTECYEHALQNELPLFYQIDEANIINAIHTRLKWILSLSKEVQNTNEFSPAFLEECHKYLDSIDEAVYSETLDTKTLRQVVSKRTLMEMRKRGKEIAEGERSSNLLKNP